MKLKRCLMEDSDYNRECDELQERINLIGGAEYGV